MNRKLPFFLTLILTAWSGTTFGALTGSTVSAHIPQPLHTGSQDIIIEARFVSPDGEGVQSFDYLLPKSWTINSLTETPADPTTCAETIGTSASTSLVGPNFDNMLVWETALPLPSCAAWHAPQSSNVVRFVANVTIPDCSSFPWSSTWRVFGENSGFESGSYSFNNCVAPTVKPLTGYSYITVTHPQSVKGDMLLGINNHQDVVGLYLDRSSNPFSYVRKNGSYQTIQFPNGNETYPMDINDNGKVVGYFRDPAGSEHGFIYTVSGGYTQYDHTGIAVTDTELYGINNSDGVVGDYYTGGGDPYGLFDDGIVTQAPLRYPGTEITGTVTKVRGINNQSDLSGTYEDSTGVEHGFLKTGAGFYDLFVPGAKQMSAMRLNDKQQVVGLYKDQNSQSHCFLFDGQSTYYTFDFPGGVVGTIPIGINNNGDIAGYYYPAFIVSPKAFIMNKFPWHLFLPKVKRN